MKTRPIIPALTIAAAAGAAHSAGATSIRDVIADNPDHRIFYEAVEAVGMDDLLDSTNGVTLFLPTDDALEDMALDINLGEQLSPDEEDQLVEFISNHIVADEIMDIDLVGSVLNAETMAGSPVFINSDGKNIRINDASVLIPKVLADNGIIHVIDSPLTASAA